MAFCRVSVLSVGKAEGFCARRSLARFKLRRNLIELHLYLSNSLQLKVELMIDVCEPFFQSFYGAVAIQGAGETF
jgi:hypothetical protein